MITREQRYGFYIGVVAGFLIGVFMLLSTGCVRATYNATKGQEQLTVTTLFKTVEGFEAERTDNSFDISIAKTTSESPISDMVELLTAIEGLRNYVPPDPPNQGD